MKTFNLGCKVTVSAYTEIEAETLEDAIAIGKSRQVVIGGTGTGALPDESWLITEADGMPCDICDDDA